MGREPGGCTRGDTNRRVIAGALVLGCFFLCGGGPFFLGLVTPREYSHQSKKRAVPGAGGLGEGKVENGASGAEG